MLRRVRAALIGVALVGIFGSFAGTAFALSSNPNVTEPVNMNKKQKDGFSRCTDWCALHNKTGASMNACFKQCEDYWATHQG